MVKSRITLQKALGTVVWHRAGGFALVQALLPDRLFIINGIVIANRVFGDNIGSFGGGFLGQHRGNGHARAHDQRKGTGSQTIPVLQIHFSSHTLSIHPNQILAGVSAMPAPGF